jgi:hypothetical protein
MGHKAVEPEGAPGSQHANNSTTFVQDSGGEQTTYWAGTDKNAIVKRQTGQKCPQMSSLLDDNVLLPAPDGQQCPLVWTGMSFDSVLL